MGLLVSHSKKEGAKIGYFRTTSEVGIYNVALPSALIVLKLSVSLSLVIFPISSELWVKGEKKKLLKGLELMQKYGVKALTLTKGKDKDALNPFRPWKVGEESSFKAIMDYDYEYFINVVTKNRPRLDKTKLINEYGAQVFDPPMAEKLGYIDDGNSSYNHALSALTEQAGIEKEGKYQVIELKVQRPVLSNLVEGKSPLISGTIKHELQIGADYPPELMNQPLYLYSPALQE